MASSDAFQPVDLSARHIDGAMALVAGASWNQSPDDWRMMMAAGVGFGCEDTDGTLIASTMVLPYGAGIGWIGMVLVAPAFQGRGLATRLVDRAVVLLENIGLMACLDATPAGEQVYIRRGFHAVFPFHRWHRLGARPGYTSSARPLDAADIAAIQSLDRAAFGASRDEFIANVARRGATCIVTKDQTAFALSREGRIAHQIGPIVARDEKTAISLFDQMQKTIQNDVFIDIPDAHTILGNRANAHGFTRQRPFKRMARGNGRIPDPGALFAIFGPELG